MEDGTTHSDRQLTGRGLAGGHRPSPFRLVERLRQAERQLRESNERLDALVKATGQIAWRETLDGIAGEMPFWCAFTGQSAEEVAGRGWLDALHPDDRDRVSAIWDEAVASRQVYQTQYRIRRYDGVYRSFIVRAIPVVNTDGTLREWIGFNTDVTEQLAAGRHAQDSLDALLAMAGALVEVPSAPGPDHVDGDNRVGSPDETRVDDNLARLICRVLNCRCLAILRLDTVTGNADIGAVAGLTAAEEERWQHIQRSRSREPYAIAGVSEELRGGRVVALDPGTPGFNAAGSDLCLLAPALLVPMLLAGNLIGMLAVGPAKEGHTYGPDEINLALGVARVTALVIERERLLREQAESRVTELALRDANHRMDEFLSVASHELRTPLTTIKANVQLVHRRLTGITDLPAEEAVIRVIPLTALMARADRQAELLNRLVGDLLDVSRIRSGRLELRLERCDLAAVVRDVVQEQRLNNPGRKIGLALPSHPVPVHADADRIGQVVTNFLTNAVKYSPEETAIEVVVEVSQRFGKVAVRDRGPGLPPAERALIWERFHRAPGVEVVSGSGVGLGLGLHISRSIIERHRGRAGVVSAVGHGSTFWFRLPLVE